MDPALYELIAEGISDDEVAVLLRLADPTAAPPNVRLIAQFGTIASCRLRRGDIVAVHSSVSVRSVKAARLYGPSYADDEDADPDAIATDVDSSIEGAEDDPFDDAEALPNDVQESDIRRPDTVGLPTGKGIVVAHVDWGVDIAHPDFRLPDGSTRLLALWDQRGAAFADRPNRYGYGRIFDREDINRALLSGDPYGTLGYDPADFDTSRGTHGTHTLSIAAGNGRGGGPVGVAPDADLVFVHLSTYTAEGPTDLGDSVAYFEAIDFVLRTASVATQAVTRHNVRIGTPNEAVWEADPEAVQERPHSGVVINSSLGRHAGPHVSRTLIEQGLDAALREAPGRAFVHSAGNYYNRRTHASGTLRPGQAHTLHMRVETDSNPPDRGTRSPSQVEIWYPGADRLAVVVIAPDGTRFEPVSGNQQASLRLLSPDAAPHEIGRLYHRLNDPNNGDNEAALFLYKGAPVGTYQFVLYGEDITDGRYHLWVERNTAGRRAQAEFAAHDSKAQFTTGTICNGFRTIAVGAYDAHAWKQNGDVPDTGRPLAPFSSSGPTRDGRQKPDLCAPGVQVLAARSCPRIWSGKAEGQPPPLLTRMSGTSMAAPHVTGTIALMFEAADRLLTIEETRRLLLVATDSPPADASVDALLRIGSGFLNTEAAVAAARAPLVPVGQVVGAPSVALVLPLVEELQPMNDAYEANMPEALEPGDTSDESYPEYYADYYAEPGEDTEDTEATDDNRRRSYTGRDMNAPSLGFVLPLGGGGIMPALSFPVGGRQSPFSVALPLGGGTSPPPPPSPAAATPSPTAPWPANAALPLPDPAQPAGAFAPYEPVNVAEPLPPESFVGRYTFDSDEASYRDETQTEADESESDEADESDEAFGERLVSVADILAEDPRARSFRSSQLLTTLLDAVGQGQGLSPLGRASGHVPSATELYNAFVHGSTMLLPRRRFHAHYAHRFMPVALPGSRLLATEVRPGDIVVRVARGENWGQVSVIAASRLVSATELSGVPAGGYAPGRYVPVVECTPVPRRRQENFVRRVTDERGETLPDTLILRVRRSASEGDGDATESDEQWLPGDETRPRVLARGATGAAVRRVQATLNRYSLSEAEGGRMPLDGCPLKEDGRFGAPMQQAVRDFQMRQFPDDASRWDGIVGPHTWGKLDTVDTTAPTHLQPPLSPPLGGRPPAIYPATADLPTLRHSAGVLIAAFVPSDTGDGRFDEIVQDYGGKGTTSGFLCHWLLWRLGCTDRNIVNRNAPDNYVYRSGENIRRIWNGGQPPFVRVLGTGRVAEGERPEQGDLVFIGTPNAPMTNAHVFVFLEEFQRDGRTFWRGADAGQRNTANKECARYSERELTIRGRDAVVRRHNRPQRTVFGWLSLANLAFGSPPLPLPEPVQSEGIAEGGGATALTADLSDGFFAAMRAVAANLRTQPQFMLDVMNSESGIRASAHNPNGHASGIIQFMPATLLGLGWTQGHEAFRQLTAEEQMPFVERYYRPFERQGLNSTARLYQATFLPATLNRGSEPDTVLVDIHNNDHVRAYAPNRGLDRRGDGRILVGDLTAFVERAKRSARWREATERLQAENVVPQPPIPPLPTPPGPPVPPTPPATRHPLLRRGARGEAVHEAQTKLNAVHSHNIAQSLPGLRGAPLAVDGIFGSSTRSAVVSFQQQAFPAAPPEWDGVIGPKTWAYLDAASAGIIPITPVVPVVPVIPPLPGRNTTDRQLSQREVVRWFVGGDDTQGQPMGRVTANNRAVHLIRGATAFAAMARAMRTATAPGHFIYLLGWWLSDDFPVAGGDTIQQLFTRASRAGVTVRAMLWDQFGRQNSAEVGRINALAGGAAILDNRTLNLGSHHHKMLIVNGAEGLYAFCGGIDFNRDRIDPVTTGSFSSGGAGSPLHDVHCQIQGPAAFDLLQIFLQRWNDHPDHVDLNRQKGPLLTAPSPAPIAGAHEWVQIGRTFGNGNAHRGIDSENLGTRPRGYTFLRGRAGEQTVKRMVLHAIGQARRFIYMEEQYLVSLEIRDALMRALPNIEHLTILIPDGSISDLPQGNFRRREFIAPLRAAGGSKVRVFHPHPPGDPFGYVHAKTWVFDDEYAIIGSANCNRRGYTHDSEVIAGICGEGSGEGLRFAHQLRVDLWALHLNMNAADLLDGVASAAFWLRPVGAGRIAPHNENADIETITTDTMWNTAYDPDGS